MSKNTTEKLLEIKNLNVSVKTETLEGEIKSPDKKSNSQTGEKLILKGVNLTINKGEVHVLMGTNGSGKSTLANVLMGHPKYIINSGEAYFMGKNLLDLAPEERAKAGMFLAFQYPTAIQGLPVGSYLRAILNAVSEENVSIRTFRKELNKSMEELEIPKKFLSRSLNEGFSGGEKKRNEILQLSLLKPKLAILDETDSGLDVDALKLVFENVNKKLTGDMSLLMITHYNRILRYINPTNVHIMTDGQIVKSGGIELSDAIEEKGFESIINS
jgi:Fe-S cluster assembly ATP-binding protein